MIGKSFALEAVLLSIGIETLGGLCDPHHSAPYETPGAPAGSIFHRLRYSNFGRSRALRRGDLLARDNRKLGVFHLTGIPPAPRGIPQIEVTFEIDSGGKLTVAAKNLETGKGQEIALALSPELSPHEIEKLVRDAEDHAAEDREQAAGSRSETA